MAEPQIIAELRSTYAERLVDLVTDPMVGVPKEWSTYPDAILWRERIPRHQMLLDAFAASCQDLRISHDDAIEYKNEFFEDDD